MIRSVWIQRLRFFNAASLACDWYALFARPRKTHVDERRRRVANGDALLRDSRRSMDTHFDFAYPAGRDQ
jgi:hypothetical protein